MNAPSRPNVIVFFTDQQRYDSTGVHGNPLDLTPNFDRLAQRGTHLYNAFTPQPVCGPARACLQSGLYATAIGCPRNGIALPPEPRPLATYFNDAGYHTAYIGKWHLGDHGDVGAVPPERRGGYQYWLAANALEFTSDAYQTRLWDNDGQPVDLPGYRVDALADAAIRYINGRVSAPQGSGGGTRSAVGTRQQEQPFFLFLSFIEPHHQNHRDDYPAPEGWRRRYENRWTPPDLEALPHWNDEADPRLVGGSAQQQLAGYWGMIKRLDEALGRIEDALRSLDLLENTVLLFTSDHGNHFKTRNGEYKRSCHDSSIRVPMAIAGPGFDGGGRVTELVSLVDLAPTLLDTCGIQVPAHMQGQSMRPLVDRRERAPWPREVFAQISEACVGRVIRTQRWKYCVTAPKASRGWVTESSADHYVETHLYDLCADPYELANLVGHESHRALADQLKERLLRRMEQAGEARPTIENAPPRKSGQRRVDDWELGQ